LNPVPRKRVRAWEQDAPPPRAPNPFRKGVRTALTVLVLLAILYVAGLVIGRTDGFRSLVAQRFEALLGMPVKIERVSVDAAYGLTVRHLVTEGTRRPTSPGLRAARLHLGWRWSDLWRRGRIGVASIELDKPVLTFERQSSGEWQPQPLAPVSEFLVQQLKFNFPPAAEPLPAAKAEPTANGADLNKKAKALRAGLETTITLRRAEVVWWAGGDTPAASVEGVRLQATPLRAPGRSLTHILLEVERASSLEGPGIRNLTVELIDTGDQQWILQFQGDHLMPARPDREKAESSLLPPGL